MFLCVYDPTIVPAGMLSQDTFDITVTAKFLTGLHGGPLRRAITLHVIEYETSVSEGEKVSVLKEIWSKNQDIQLR